MARHYAHVWLGTSVENMDYAWRIDCLRTVPAEVRFVSYEPALGSLAGADLTDIDWLIYGGESGPDHRGDRQEWAQEAEELCGRFGAAFYFKQSSGPRPGTNRYHNLSVREFPEASSDADRPSLFATSI